MKTDYTTSKGKELVALRKRQMASGGFNLYLDYTYNGVRRREFLHMFLIPERNKIDRIQNQETMKLANAVKAKRILEMQEGRMGIVKRKTKNDATLISFLGQQQQFYREQDKNNYVLTLSKIIRWLKNYKRTTTIQTVDKDYILDFVRFMRESGLSEGTVYMYFSNLNTVFNNAYRDELINFNPISKIDHSQRPKRPESEREYLTLDEVKILADTRCRNENVKAAFLFACFTGLRLSDIEALSWEQIRMTKTGWQVEGKQIKTRKVVYVPLSANALAQLPENTVKSGKVFHLPSREQIGDNLLKWIKRANINKHITFHCARHTYATLLITYGANLYTVSSLLGHTNVQTTQIYAKIVDENKRKTVDLIPDII